MSGEALKIINTELKGLGINYRYGNYKAPVPDRYFTGEYSEVDISSEDGRSESTFMLNGFSRDVLLLEADKQKIEKHFRNGITAIAPNGDAVAVFYSNSLCVPTGDDELVRLQINLIIKEWKVN